MSTVGWLPAPVEDLFGTDATAEESYDVLTVDVPPSAWLTALETARTTLGCTYFDWLSAVDEPGTGFRVSAHVVALGPVRRLLVRTTLPHEAPELPSAVGVYAGAAWHERETHEMFGVRFTGHPGLDHLLLPETFEGHPLRKDFVLAARVAKAWPGAKEPGEPAAGAAHAGPKRRQMLPPGVPDPNEWGPLKGQLPPAPARPARGAAAGRAAGDRPARAGAPAAGDRPVRRTRTATEGSASQTSGAATEAAGTVAGAPAADTGAGARPRRMRSASQGSASQTPAPAEGGGETGRPVPEAGAGEAASAEPSAAATPTGPRRSRSASQGSASQRADAPMPEQAQQQEQGRAPGQEQAPAEPEGASRPARRSTAPHSSDAPWHHARPAFDEPEAASGPTSRPEPEREPETEPESGPEREPESGQAEGPAGSATAEPPERPEPPSTPDRTPGGDTTGGPQ